MNTTATTTALLKLGGEVVAEESALRAVLADVRALCEAGWRFVLCHGGGPQAGALQERLGVPTVKVGGRRVTDPPTLQIMKQVLAGEVSVDLVAAAVAAGLPAVGLSGVSCGLVTAHRRPPARVSGGGDAPVDFGFVGDIDEIRPAVLLHLWAGGYVPVLNSLGLDGSTDPQRATRQVYNINADTVASAVAAALRVDHLFLVTGIGGVMRDKDDPTTRIPVLHASEARQAIADGTVVGGMIPKIEEALDNLRHGIGAVHIIGPRAGCLEQAARRPGTQGTALLPDDA
ncbi:acetylglutamate kinase [Paraliomyxa miuraensis]|uniref:acetylglutamate kinase n=1 Tax=Paraliomyxa miuraensis TaxID=376150 RepID=UPI0022527EE9|nr:acetylglutamate kinase [Paraliomyxa miuraensis]MCX4239363.1 acetylglutamate kinase [Paraliomyxa miuraensis]